MRKKNGGFTLMELLIVVAIILVLAGAIVSRMTISSEKAKEAKAKAELDEIAAGCRSFYMDTGLWPRTMDSLLSEPANGYDEDGSPDTGVALTTGTWKGPYLESRVIPNDPWGSAYVLQKLGLARAYYLQARAPAGSAPDITLLVHRFST